MTMTNDRRRQTQPFPSTAPKSPSSQASHSSAPPAGLNAAQQSAVRTLAGPVLVLAGAGTGKTRVITHRIAELIRTGVAPDRILSVTFTNKAAREMRERTTTILGRRLKSPPCVSTFHSLCARILREEITHLGYPQRYRIVDRSDQESLARGVLREIRVTEKSLRPGDLLSIISRWKSVGISPSQSADVADSDKEFLAAMAFRKYQEKLKSSGAVDFDDLLLLTEQLFQEFPEVLDRQRRKFAYVQIDEYQDTNGIQFRLIESLVQEHRNLCVVGDDDQAIYGWRGAEVQHILGFQSHYPDAQVYRLEDNYRCTDQILQAANRLVGHNRGRHPKTLRAHKFAQEAVRVLEYPDEQLEAEMVVREIRFLIQQKSVAPGDFAILFRTNEQPRLFESELRRTGIPYLLVGSHSFYDRKEIRDLLSYLKVISRPDDETSLLRIINTPARGIGPRTVEQLLERAVRDGMSFWKAVDTATQEGRLTGSVAPALQQFRRLLSGFRHRFEESPRQMETLLRELIHAIGYESEIEKQYKEPEQRLARSASVDEFVNSLSEYIGRSGQPTIDDFLASLALEDRAEEPDKDDQARENAVKLMTLHSAKGLEFPRVYMVGMEEGLLPHKRSVDATDREIEEERRLCYVGITRAKDVLTLSRAATRKRRGKVRGSLPSRFLVEMLPAEHVALHADIGN